MSMSISVGMAPTTGHKQQPYRSKKFTHFEAAFLVFSFLLTTVPDVHGIRDAVYATIFIMSSVVRLATTGFMSSVQVPLRKPCCISNIWRIK